VNAWQHFQTVKAASSARPNVGKSSLLQALSEIQIKKNNLSRYLRSVEAGEELEVTDHNRPIARLIPVETKTRLQVRPPLRPFSEIRDKVYPPTNSSVDLRRAPA